MSNCVKLYNISTEQKWKEKTNISFLLLFKNWHDFNKNQIRKLNEISGIGFLGNPQKIYHLE